LNSRVTGLFTACLTMALLAGCSTTPTGRDGAGTPAPAPAPTPRAGGGGYYLDDGPGSGTAIDPMQVPDAVARAEPLNPRANRPYVVFGQSYVPMTELQAFKERGIATWYGRRYHGRRTSSGEPYDMYAMTAAHPRLPLPSYARVTNLANARSVVVRVNDRGPFLHGRVIDLSWTAAARLGFANRGTAEVEVELITEFDDPTIMRATATNAPTVPGTAAAASAAAASAAAPTRPPAGTSTSGQAAAGDARAGGSAVPASSPVPGLTLTTVSTSAAPQPAALATTQDNNGLPPLQREVLVRHEETARSTTASPAQTGASSSATRPGVFLQLGAFQSRANAEAARAQYLKSLDWPADKLSIRSDGRLHRVVAGPYADRQEAQTFTERIRTSTGVQALPLGR
jgi:rare lipoprotein A